MSIWGIAINASEPGVCARYGELIEAEKLAREVYTLRWAQYRPIWERGDGNDAQVRAAHQAWVTASTELQQFIKQYGVSLYGVDGGRK